MAAAAHPGTARADLYDAVAAVENKNFARAFELYRELAELGHRESQENIAAMYVNGEGVKRDNVLGYAWAALAMENGGGETAQAIVKQLEPHLNAAARARIAEVQARFGKAALQERLLPAPPSVVPVPKAAHTCQMKIPANPQHFYPLAAKREGISGSVLVEATVAPDGRARNARVWYSLPADVFDEAARRVALSNAYTAPKVNGVVAACTIRFRVRFTAGNGDGGNAEQKKVLAQVREKARAGDPHSQIAYGLLLELRPDMNVENERTLDWFVKAAQGGVPSAQYLVGMYCLSAVVWNGEKNDSKGLAWLQMAVDAGQAEAQTGLANYLLRGKPDTSTFGRAQSLLEKAVGSGNRDAKYFLAGLLATGPDAAQRDPKRALELLLQVSGELDFDPTFFEIRAAANAQLGDFAEAKKNQMIALQRATKLGWDSTDQQARLGTYAASKPWAGNLFAY
jgi:TonB family protein